MTTATPEPAPTLHWMGWVSGAKAFAAEARWDHPAILDVIMANPPAWSTRLHVPVDGVDWFKREAPGPALCGVTIPAYDMDQQETYYWTDESDGVPKCKRCMAAVEGKK